MTKRLKEFRFALGSPEAPCSTTWRVWTSGEEAYLAARVWAVVAKLSLHAGGRWSFNAGMLRAEWRRPMPFELGWIQGPVLVIPHNDLPSRHPYIDPHRAAPTTWLADSPPGMATQIEMVFAAPGVRGMPVRLGGATPLAALWLRDEGMLHVVRRNRALLPEEADRILETRRAEQARPNPAARPYTLSAIAVESHQFRGPLLFETQLESHPNSAATHADEASG
ncbi:MAG: hypothetical protein IT352_04055 [Gemmatimonadales bacterium]|nr:hypothetical protein [Gemmatimonadales bacterium]